ncbi:spindle and centriole-associated protein 1 [Aplysia californica]|uniref:Spindle and centriole-associated protein 1 n=1 Tax=Aplysia californica TaxID=6500 RepID=A0ABM0K1Q9_APLCA|nr:spindle and centriole-associated protein 1 [Aplysia californica]
MSFYRIGGQSRRKRPTRKKPDWDDSVNDLTVLRATPEEVLLRKESHKSKNHISVKLEKMRKEKQRKKLTGAEAKQLAIMKEVLYDQQQLESVLAKSDTMMAVVKDLFGDDPKRFQGFPNVTTAPCAETSLSGSSSLVAPVPDIYTRSEKLSDSVMDQSALNDVEDSDSDEDDEEIDQPEPISYQPKMNLQRFQEYLQEEEKRSVQQDPPSLVSGLANGRDAGHRGDNQSHNSNNNNNNNNNPSASSSANARHAARDPTLNMKLLTTILRQTGQGDSPLAHDPHMMNILLAAMSANGGRKEPARDTSANGGRTEPRTPPRNELAGPPLPSDRTPPSAINDTRKIKKTKKIVKSPNASSVSSDTTASMSDMRKVLHQLELELSQYEHQTGRQTHGPAGGTTETFSGYTVALVDAVARLTRYLKETDLRVRTEVTLREQLTQDVYQLRTIIDALATDLIVTQEEYGKLYAQHQRHRDSTQGELSSLKKQVEELTSLVAGTRKLSLSQGVGGDHSGQGLGADQEQQQQQQQQQQKQQQQNFQDFINTSKKSDDNKTSSPLPSHLGKP